MIALEDSFQGGSRQLLLRRPEPTADGGVQWLERTLQVSIPKGIRAGQQIRLLAQGSSGMADGPRGDLYLEVEFAPHKLWRVDGPDLFLTLPITPWEAALGAALTLPTPSGSLEVAVPAGSKTGQKLRLRGRGMPGTPPGDFYALLEMVTPPAVDDKVRAAYQRMAENMAFDPRANLGVPL